MGRRSAYLWRQESHIRMEEGEDQGCIWGLFRLLNYQNVKKMLPHKKHGAKIRSKTNRDVGKVGNRLNGVHEEENMAKEANPISVEWVNPPETSSASKKSIKVRIRDLMAKEENSKCRVSDLPEQSQSQRGHGGNIDSSSKDKLVENVDILEIFKVNKQIFLKILNDQDLARVNQFIKPDILHNKARLTKSGSFPTVNSTQMRDRSPSKLEDKQREIWPPLKGKDSGDGSQITASKAKFRSMRRASSLTESMDRYAQLYNSSFNKEVKRNLSRSLKLVSENDEPTPKFRTLSLPECNYESFLPNLEASIEAVECGPDSIKDSVNLDVNAKGNSFESAGEPCEDIMNKALDEEISHQEQRDVAEGAMDCDAQGNQGVVSECPYEEDEIGAVEFPISEDYGTSNLEKAENPEILKTDKMLPTALVDEEHDPEFHYVKLVLELPGFTAKEQTWVWYTVQQPLNPAVFEEIEKHHYPFEQLKCSTKMEGNKWFRKLIFDLINEALMEIDERSYLYYPKALSFSCRVHPVPKGHRLLEEVWAFVGSCLSWRPELDPKLDFAVAQDLHGRHAWMNLQLESECVALELGDMILDELLLDEILLAHS